MPDLFDDVCGLGIVSRLVAGTPWRNMGGWDTAEPYVTFIGIEVRMVKMLFVALERGGIEQ